MDLGDRGLFVFLSFCPLSPSTPLPDSTPDTYIVFFFYVKELKKKKKGLGQIKSSKDSYLMYLKYWITKAR